MRPEQLKAEQDRLIGDGPNRSMKPHPGGLPGRIVDAHDDGDEALAKALTDAWMAEDGGG